MLTNEHMKMAVCDICATVFGFPSADFRIWMDTMDESYIRIFAFYKDDEFYIGNFYEITMFESMLGLLASLTTYASDIKHMLPDDELLAVVLEEFKKAIATVQEHMHNALYDESMVRELMNVAMDSMLQMAHTLVEAKRSVESAVGKA
jgi:hypothetical protein